MKNDLTGITDEAGASAETQIKIAKALNYSHIEVRKMDEDLMVHDGSLDDFKQFWDKVQSAGLGIIAFGTAVANWKRHPLDDNDFKETSEELNRSLERMKISGTKYLRGMSFKTEKVGDLDSPELKKTIHTKVGELVKRCEDAGVIYLHENCMNFAGLSVWHTLDLLEAVNSPNLQLVFDTANPALNWDEVGASSGPRQDGLAFYRKVKNWVKHIHVKDSRYTSGIEKNGRPSVEYCWPGEGDCKVREILDEALNEDSYEGMISIEPHLGSQFHDPDSGSALPEKQYSLFLEYGKRLEKLVGEIKSGGKVLS